LWAAWPQNATTWAALLATQAQAANFTNLSPPLPAYISLWSRYVWDGTLFLAKAISAAWTQCEFPPPFYDRPSRQCLMEFIRNTTLNGTTGPIALDEKGDRQSQFAVFNMVDRQRVQTGTLDATHTVAEIDVAQIVWSDGVSNRLTAPTWGQLPHPSTPAPTSSVVFKESESEITLYISTVASAVLVLVVFGIVLKRHRKRIRAMKPADFAQVTTLSDFPHAQCLHDVTWIFNLYLLTHNHALSVAGNHRPQESGGRTGLWRPCPQCTPCTDPHLWR
jgi:hypothetical protein